MMQPNSLAARFEEQRPRLRGLAYRMLGSANEADDAIQEAWLRLSRIDASEIENLGGWLTTVVSRVCLDMLRSRKRRGEESLEEQASGSLRSNELAADPEQEALLAEAVGMAMLVVLERLSPAERVAFVLHDMFGLTFDEIAPIVGRTTAATRQLASRGRRRVRGASMDLETEVGQQRQVVEAFFSAAREGDLDGLLALLDPDVVLRADAAAVQAASLSAAAPQVASEMHGASTVATIFKGRAKGGRAALVNGEVGAFWGIDGRPRGIFFFTLDGDRITQIEIVVDPGHVREVELVTIDG